MSLRQNLGGSILEVGSQGPIVQDVQVSLKALGYPLSGTGYFGMATDTAVRAFQRKANLKPDGAVGPATAGAIDEALAVHAGSGPTPVAQISVDRPLWLQAGLALIGTHEGVGAADNPKIIEWAKELGGDVAAEYTHDSIPWCALFANHCLGAAGLPGTGTLWALDFAGHWPSVQLQGPAVGAFAPMVRSGGGHIIQIVGLAANGNVMGLGGNQSDAVNVEQFARSRLNRGFWWPKSVPPPPVGWDKLPIVSSAGSVVSTRES